LFINDETKIVIKDNILSDEKYTYLFSVEAVNELVNKGIPFRDAYAQVGNQIEKGEFKYDPSKELHHTHEGSIGNLCNEEIKNQMMKIASRIEKR
jgi:argininosuccinate lyase